MISVHRSNPVRANLVWAWKSWINGDIDYMRDRLYQCRKYYDRRRIRLRLKLWLDVNND